MKNSKESTLLIVYLSKIPKKSLIKRPATCFPLHSIWIQTFILTLKEANKWSKIWRISRKESWVSKGKTACQVKICRQVSRPILHCWEKLNRENWTSTRLFIEMSSQKIKSNWKRVILLGKESCLQANIIEALHNPTKLDFILEKMLNYDFLIFCFLWTYVIASIICLDYIHNRFNCFFRL